MPITFDIIQIICALTLFVIVGLEYRAIHKRDLEIRRLNSEIDTLNFNIAAQEVKVTDNLLKSNSEILPVITRIQKRYNITKVEKLKLLNFLIILMRDIDINLLQQVKIGKPNTFKDTTSVILDFIKNPRFTEPTMANVVNAIYWLIVK